MIFISIVNVSISHIRVPDRNRKNVRANMV